MEIVDVVDQHNIVLSQISKDEAHKHGLLHRCIIAELIDSQGNWTLVKQAGDRQDPMKFVSPVGGHIQAGEKETDALARETSEEIGITHFTSKRIGQAIFNREVNGKKENHLFILYELHSDEKPILNHESVGFETFSPEQLKQEYTDHPEKFGAAFHFVFDTFYS